MALKDAFNKLTLFVADNDLEEAIVDEYPFGLSLDDQAVAVADWADALVK